MSAAGGRDVRVLIADDEALVRAGLALIVDLEPGLAIAGEAADGQEAVARTRALAPDVVLMDIRMPNLDGIAATRRIVEAGSPARVLILSTFGADEQVYAGLLAGASGFLLKDVPREQLVAGIRIVADGGALLAPAITRRLIQSYLRRPPPTPRPPARLGDLTPRELEVLRLLARGLSNAEIAEALVLGEATVKTHVARILAKLGLRDRVQAVVAAFETGLARPGDDEAAAPAASGRE
ncbi:MAG TPA: response regulator transcription factor [Miltoncostaeaceae bacterium]|nr:response regulator transcription factor [Miltoncostaeaceae bacterium]